MPYLLAQQDSWPASVVADEPLRSPLGLIRTLAEALAAEEQPSLEHRRRVARQIARAAEQLERSPA